MAQRLQKIIAESGLMSRRASEAAILEGRVTVNGINGLYLRSKINGNQLFFPASGNGGGRSWDGRGSNGYFWSSTFGSARDARGLRFGSGGVDPARTGGRCSGRSVRPVQ